MGEFTDVVEKRFRTSGMPRLAVENVSGRTVLHAGEGEEVVVRAKRRVRAEGPDRARRILDNVDIQMEQHGDEIRVSHRAYLVERGWIGLFREGRVSIDYEIDLPRQAAVETRSTSGEIEVTGVEGPVACQTVSGDVRLDQLRGPLRVRTVSGDCEASRCAGALEANSVSGDLTFRACAFPSARVRTVSGDLEMEAKLGGKGPFDVVTVSGDVSFATPTPLAVELSTASGDLHAARGMHLDRQGKKRWRASHERAEAEVFVRTVSGDVEVEDRSVEAPEGAVEEAAPVAPERDRKAEAIAVLDLLAKGEIDVDEAGRRLDASR